MSTNQANIHYVTSSVWRRRKLIILPTLIFTFLGFLFAAFAAKPYFIDSTVLINGGEYVNPFLDNLKEPRQKKSAESALNTILHGHDLLLKVATLSGLIKSKQSKLEKSEVLTKLSKSLTLSVINHDLINIRYTYHDPTVMEKVMKNVTHEFSLRYKSAIDKLGVGHGHTGRALDQIGKNIAGIKSELAKQRSKYTNNHSEIISAEKELKLLKEERNNILHYNPLGGKALPSYKNSYASIEPINEKLHHELDLVVDTQNEFRAYPRTPAIFYFVASILGGLIFGSGLVVIAEYCDTSIRRRDYLESLLSRQVLTRLQHVNKNAT